MVNKCHYQSLDMRDVVSDSSQPGLTVYWEATVEILHQPTCKVIMTECPQSLHWGTMDKKKKKRMDTTDFI